MNAFRPYRPRVNPDTYIRDLPYYILQKIARQLDPDGTSTTWRDLALRIPQNAMNPTPRFTTNDIQYFEMCSRQGRSPTITLLSSWGTTNVTAQDLISILHRMNLPKLAEMIIPKEDMPNLMRDPRFPLDDPPPYQAAADPKPVQEEPEKNDTSLYSAPSYFSSMSSVSKTREPIEHDSLSYRRPTENCATDTSISESLENITLERNLPSFSYSDLSELTSNFNESCKLGEGAFGSVFSGNLNAEKQKEPVSLNSRKIAIKRLKLDAPDLAVAVAEQFKKEIHIISELEHENILPLVGYSCDGPELCLVYDFMFNGSLSSNLQGCRAGKNKLTILQRIHIAEGSAAGIEYLHGKSLVHRDIKSSNILLDTETRPRIGDFGLIRSVFPAADKTSTATNNPIGTLMYMAPEAIRGEVSPAMDVFGFGIVLLELMTSQAVHDEAREPKSLEMYVSEACDDDPSAIMGLVDKGAGEWGEETATEFYDLASNCLEYRRKKRPTMTKVRQELKKLKTT